MFPKYIFNGVYYRIKKEIGVEFQNSQQNIIFALHIDPWCNGSTTDSGSVGQGSSPCGLAFFGIL